MSEERDTVNDCASFAVFHAQKCADTQIYKSTSRLLPLIDESVNSHITIRHVMAQVKIITEKVNPCHVLLSTCLCSWNGGTMDVSRIQRLRLHDGTPSHRDGFHGNHRGLVRWKWLERDY